MVYINICVAMASSCHETSTKLPHWRGTSFQGHVYTKGETHKKDKSILEGEVGLQANDQGRVPLELSLVGMALLCKIQVLV